MVSPSYSSAILGLPPSKRLLISWLHSPSAMILDPKKIKSDTVSTVPLSISHEVIGTDAMILLHNSNRASQVALVVKNLPANARDAIVVGSIL